MRSILHTKAIEGVCVPGGIEGEQERHCERTLVDKGGGGRAGREMGRC